MPLDAVCLTAILEELRPRLIGARVDKIQQPEKDKLLLSLRGRGGGGKLLLSARPGRARLQLSAHAYENPQSPPMFCMLLRKHLTGARLSEIRQPPMERIARLRFDTTDPVGEPVVKELLLELMGNSCNLILLDQEGIILEAMRRVDEDLSRGRCVLPGLYYRLPASQGKRNPLEMEREEMARLLAAAPPDTRLDKWMLDNFFGLSPLICREVVNRLCGETDAKLGEDEALREAFLDALGAFFATIRAGEFAPYLISQGEVPLDFSYTPIKQYGGEATLREMESFSALLDGFYEKRDFADRLRQRAGALMKTVTNLRDKTARKLEIQKQEKAFSEERAHFREKGDIVTANLHAIARGQTSLKAQNFYDPAGGAIEVSLDPRKSPAQNAAFYYKQYARAKAAETHLTEQMRKAESELSYLNSVLEAMGRAETAGDVAQIRQELVEAGFLRATVGEKKRKIPPSGPLRFRSSSGLRIYAGKNNLQNDQLTFKTAHRGDMWLHTQKIHGAHVRIASAGQMPDQQTLLEAASIAAFYSQGREGTKIAVDYTLVKNVKKPAGGPPGAAHYVEYKTIYAEPDEALVKRLREEK